MKIIMRTNDWKKLIELCKEKIKKTEGDKRAARGLLYRLSFYISENRLVKPSRRKQEPPIQALMFDRGSRGEPLSPKEVTHGSRVSESQKFSEGEKAREVSQSTDPGGRDQIQVEEGGPEIPGIIDAGKGWPDLEP
jgi:hypothetical protein